LLSVCQIKSARAILGWSAADLAEKSGVGATTLRRYEMGSGIPNANVKTLQAIKSTFEDAGVEFLGDPLVNPGVMLHLG
jgi:transcriptional regulator with XRE-family HTH domain